jgi:hypothetical protein
MYRLAVSETWVRRPIKEEDSYRRNVAHDRNSWSAGVARSGMYAKNLERVNVNPDFRGERGDARDVVVKKAGRNVQKKYIARSLMGMETSPHMGYPGGYILKS